MSACWCARVGAMGKPAFTFRCRFARRMHLLQLPHKHSVGGPLCSVRGAVCREICEHAALLRAAGVEWSEAQERAASEIVVWIRCTSVGHASLLEPALLADMLRALRETFACAWEEVTLEADPKRSKRKRPYNGRPRESSASAWGRNPSWMRSSRPRDACTGAKIFTGRAILRDAGICNISFDLIAGYRSKRGKAGHVAR